MKRNKVDLSHIDTKPLDEFLDSEEFKKEVDNYKTDKSYMGSDGLSNEDLVEYHKNILSGYGL